MNKFQKELVSRGTAAAIGLPLLYAGWRCLNAGLGLGEKVPVRFNLPFMLGLVLLIVGAFPVLYALLPFGLMSWLFRSAPPRMGENDTFLDD